MTERRVIQPPGWPRAAGYSDGVSVPAGRTIFVAGQVGWDPATQQFRSDDFAAQFEQALSNIVAVLKAAGAGPEHVVRITGYVRDAAEYHQARPALAAAWKAWFGRHYPAMAFVVVAGFIEPRARLELEATAVVPGE